jgi:hypothetical protein
MGFLVRFTEPLNGPPIATIRSEGVWGLFNYGSEATVASPYNRNDSFWQIGAECNPNHLGAGSVIGITVQYAVDLDGEELSQPFTFQCTMNISGGCNPR